jgi:hypothetical protein
VAIAKLQNNITGGTSGVLTGVSAGSLLVACATVSANTAITYSDNNGGTWATAGSYYDTSVLASVSIGYAMNVPSGSTTVTFVGAGAFQAIALAEFSGAAVTSALDNTPAGNHVSTGATHTATSVSPSVAGCLVVCCDDSDGGTQTVGTGFTLIGFHAGSTFGAEFQIQTTATPVAPTFTVSPNSDGGLLTAVFRAGGSAANPLPDLVMAQRWS